MSRRVIIGVLSILLAMFAIEVTTSRQESQTIDEAVHLSAGLSYWRTGDFRMNPEHPPLVKMLAALPLVFTKATLPLNDISWRNVDQWRFGSKFLYENRLSPDTLLLLGRLPIMLLSLVLGWFIFRTSRAMFGTAGGFLALGLYAFDPNIIAHSRLVTTDLGFSAMAFFTLVRLQRLWDAPTLRNTVWFSVMIFITGLTKFSIFAFCGALAVFFIIMKIREPRHAAVRAIHIIKTLAIGIPIALVVTWAVYGFDVRRPIDDPRVTLLYAQRQEAITSNALAHRSIVDRFVVNDLGDPTTPIGRVIDRLKDVRYPLYTYFRGAISVLGHSETGQTSFLLGQVRDLGWWYYFPVAFIAKTPLPTLAGFLGAMSIGCALLFAARRRSGKFLEALRTIDRRWLVYGVPPLAFFVISLFSHLNLGWRHIMPIYPPLFVLAGSLATVPLLGRRTPRWVLPSVFVAAALATELATYPNQIGYFSPLVGGGNNGKNIIRDSNLDWGQDLPKLRRYMETYHIASIHLSYYGSARAAAYIPNATPVPTTVEVVQQGRPSGYAAISIENLYAVDGRYRWLQSEKPIAKLGSSIFVFHL